MTAPVVCPIVHLNGTGAAALLEAACEAGRAVRAAQRALEAAAPNQRDYYPAPGRWEAALEQYRARHAHLAAVLASIVAEAEAIAEAQS